MVAKFRERLQLCFWNYSVSLKMIICRLCMDKILGTRMFADLHDALRLYPQVSVVYQVL